MAYMIYIADVYCPWCYGFAPIMRRLAAMHPELPVKVIGGNLISQPVKLAEDAASQPGLTDFWRQVEHKTGRSLEGAIKAVETGADVRLYSPGADEILVALDELAPGHELEQIIELEDMFYEQGLDLFTDESLGKIAARWKINPSALNRVLDEQATLQATEQRLQEASELLGEVTSYPTIILVNNGQYARVSSGYVHYETVLARLNDVMKELGVEVRPASLMSLYRSNSLHPSKK